MKLIAGLLAGWKGKLAVGVSLAIGLGLILTKWVDFTKWF